MDERHLLVSYDVVNNRKRLLLAKYLKGYLERVQKSVFEGIIPDRQLEALKREIGSRIDRTEDTVRIYTLCQRCASSVEIIGTGVPIEPADEDIVI
ncbi:MAG: CRISPR-associated endonuclease Cas2 [Candidatus Methylomirabilales bacterium]